MNTKPDAPDGNEKTTETPAEGTGADGSKAQPKTGDQGPKWPGGGKKGEDE